MPTTPELNAEAAWSQVCAVVTEAMPRLQVPGVALGVLCDAGENARAFAAGFGVTNIAHPLTVTDDTLFRVESITKTLTATAAMCLVGRGTLDLDAPVRRYLPDLSLADSEAAAHVTLRHLVTHTAGWEGDSEDDTGDGDDALARFVARMDALAQLAPPGAFYSYNNIGFALLGRVIEVVTETPYEAAMRALVLGPLGMEHSRFFAREVITDRVAVGHDTTDTAGAGPRVNRVWAAPRASNPQGGLITTVRDMLRYARFHLSDGIADDGVRLLAPEAMAAMQSPLVAVGGKFDAVGAAWRLRDVNGVRVVRHEGSRSGQYAQVLLVPARGFALTVLTNADCGAALIEEVGAAALAHFLGLVAPEPSQPLNLPPIAMPTEALAAYDGSYRVRVATVTVTPADDGLTVQVTLWGKTTPPAPARFYATDHAVITEGPFAGARVDFLRNADGQVGWLRIAERVHARQP